MKILRTFYFAFFFYVLLIACTHRAPICEQERAAYYVHNGFDNSLRYTSYSQDSVLFDTMLMSGDSMLLYEFFSGEKLEDPVEYYYSDSVFFILGDIDTVCKVSRVFSTNPKHPLVYIRETCVLGKENFIYGKSDDYCRDIYLWDLDSVYLRNYVSFDTCYTFNFSHEMDKKDYHWMIKGWHIN